MSFRNWRILGWALGIGATVLVFVGLALGDFWHSVWAWSGIVLAVAAIVLNMVKCNCPSCHKHISDRSPWGTTHCPYCGEDLTQKQK